MDMDVEPVGACADNRSGMSSYSPPFRLRFPRTAIAYLDGAPVEIVTIDYLRELGNE